MTVILPPVPPALPVPPAPPLASAVLVSVPAASGAFTPASVTVILPPVPPAPPVPSLPASRPALPPPPALPPAPAMPPPVAIAPPCPPAPASGTSVTAARVTVISVSPLEIRSLPASPCAIGVPCASSPSMLTPILPVREVGMLADRVVGNTIGVAVGVAG